VVAAHAGGDCASFENPRDLSSCEPDEEIFEVARALPPGSVDIIAAGHSHAGVAHVVNGIAIVEAYAYGRAFSRVDVELDRTTGRVLHVVPHPPHDMCQAEDDSIDNCQPGAYEGAPVVPDPDVVATVMPDLQRAEEVGARRLGVRLETEFPRDRDEETALGNLIADLMREAVPDADVALINGGGIRQGLPPGDLTYRALFEMFPFDNELATVRLTGRDLRTLIESNLQSDEAILSLSGVIVHAQCRNGALVVDLRTSTGRTISDGDAMTLVTTDFVATGGDAIMTGLAREPGALRMLGRLVRDEVVQLLGQRGGILRADDPSLFNGAARRFRLPAARPVRCNDQP